MAETDPPIPLVLPVIPEQGPGINFEITEDQLIGVAKSGLASDTDITEIGGLKQTLLEALDDLLSATDNSNAFKTLNTVANRYKAALVEERPSIDILFGQGMRFGNNVIRVRDLIARGELPEADLAIAEALDTVVALNGTVILSTTRGQELIRRSNDYDRSQAEAAQLKAELRKLNDAVQASKKLFTKEAKQALNEVVEEAGQGKHPNRTASWSEWTTSNLLSLSGKTALQIAASTLAMSEPGQLLVQASVPLINTAWYFLLQNQSIIRDIAAIGGQNYQHLNSLINVLVRYNTPQALSEYFNKESPIIHEEIPALRPADFDMLKVREIILNGKALPEEWVPFITTLDLGGAEIIDLNVLHKLTALRVLDLHGTPVVDLHPLRVLRNLESLNLSGTQVLDLSALHELTGLRVLLLRNTPVSEIYPLRDMKFLLTLDLSNTQVSDISALRFESSIQILKLSNTTVSDITPLSGMSSLRNLDLRGTKVFDLTPLQELFDLESLSVKNTLVSDLSPLLNLTELKEVEIGNTQVSSIDVLRGMPNIEKIYLNKNSSADYSAISKWEKEKAVKSNK